MNDFAFFLVFFFGSLLFFSAQKEGPPKPNHEDVYVVGQDKKINFSSRARQTIENAYGGMNQEFPFCLHGEKKEDGSFFVNELKVPYVLETSKSSGQFSAKKCKSKPDFLGVIHNHRSASCFPSRQDLDRFYWMKEAEIEVISCGPDEDKTLVGITKSDKRPDFFEKP